MTALPSNEDLARLALSLPEGDWVRLSGMAEATVVPSTQYDAFMSGALIQGDLRIVHDGDPRDPTCVAIAEAIALLPALLREVLDRREAEGWRDISTAPNDGNTVLVYVPDFEKVTEAWFCEQTGLWPQDNAYSYDGKPCNVGLPTHWRPLPAPPSTPTTEASHGE